MNLHFYDAHNHLQDPRLDPFRTEVLAGLQQKGVQRIVVNGSCEEDWPSVAELARGNPIVLPAFGYHPWYVRERTALWRENLIACLDADDACIGEIGLDRWIKDPDIEAQEEVFTFQLRLAAERNLPVTIHCLQAWGWLMDILRREKLPSRGFLLHSYGGSPDLVTPLAELGAYFSFSGYFARPDKEKKRDAFRRVPLNRLLIETDAPDMLPPAELITHLLPSDAAGKPINDPRNLISIYQAVASLRGIEFEALASIVQTNFSTFFLGD